MQTFSDLHTFSILDLSTFSDLCPLDDFDLSIGPWREWDQSSIRKSTSFWCDVTVSKMLFPFKPFNSLSKQSMAFHLVHPSIYFPHKIHHSKQVLKRVGNLWLLFLALHENVTDREIDFSVICGRWPPDQASNLWDRQVGLSDCQCHIRSSLLLCMVFCMYIVHFWYLK